jgi:hypothetical protein
LHARLPVLAIVAVTCAGHALSVVLARDLPRDLNLAYLALPPLYAGDVRLLLEPGGWYNGLLAAWMRLVGPSGPAFAAVPIVWVALTVLGAAGMARAWAGDRAAIAAAAVAAQAPAIVMIARTGWIHAPEAALLSLGGWALATDPALSRWRTVAALAVTGALALSLRTSGLVWVGVLAVASLRGWRRLPWVLAAWALASAPLWPTFAQYVGGKAGVRERYAMTVEGLGHQLLFHLGPGGCALVLLGAALLRVRPPVPLGVLVGGWAAAALGLYAAFRAGLDNFPLLYVAAAVVAGAGLGARTWATGLAVAAWLAYTGVTAWHDLTGPPKPDQAATIARLLDETCPTRSPASPCVVVADDGLFAPFPEEPGRLELFLMGEEATRVTSLRETRMNGPAPHAFATWSCPAQRGGPRDPRGQQKRAGLVARWGMAEVARTPFEDCEFVWMRPTAR